jgi:hypothetical protein
MGCRRLEGGITESVERFFMVQEFAKAHISMRLCLMIGQVADHT